MEHKHGNNDVKSPWTYTGYRTIWTLEWIPQIIPYGYLEDTYIYGMMEFEILETYMLDI